jgi:aminomethyltransferase
MSSIAPTGLKKTPLNARHRASGARLVEFAGWEMPLEYSSITDEHLAVRARAGLFDVSHMGEIELAGVDALAAVQWLTCNDASRLAVGQAQYSALTTPAGTVVDDVLVYRLAMDHYLLVVNASHIVKDHQWVSAGVRERGGDVAVVNASSRYALVALQGPASEAVLQALTGVDLAGLDSFCFASGEVAAVRATITRTGYTGEDGFEIFVPPARAERVWDAILEAGGEAGVRPCGLGARDTLRLEAGLRLCGSDMDETTTMLEAGLGWAVAWDKPEFQGAEALRRQKAEGLTRRLVGFEMKDRGIARHGYPVMRGAEAVGVVTSGTFTPFLKKAIGFAMVPIDLAARGSAIDIEIRGRRARAEVVSERFYKRT